MLYKLSNVFACLIIAILMVISLYQAINSDDKNKACIFSAAFGMQFVLFLVVLMISVYGQRYNKNRGGCNRF